MKHNVFRLVVKRKQDHYVKLINMSNITIFIDSLLQGNQLSLTKEKHHHLTKVLRIRKNDTLRLVVSEKMLYTCVLDRISPDTLFLTKVSASPLTISSLQIHLYQALPKGDKFSDIIKMCIQLGLNHIQPIISQHCDVKAISAAKFKRLNHCILSAAEQSHQSHLAKIMPPIPFQNSIDLIKNNNYDLSLFCYEFAKTEAHLVKTLLQSDRKKIKKIAVIIGPEGGFSNQEVSLAKSAGLVITHLSTNILRTEHAGFCALSMIKGALESHT